MSMGKDRMLYGGRNSFAFSTGFQFQSNPTTVTRPIPSLWSDTDLGSSSSGTPNTSKWSPPVDPIGYSRPIGSRLSGSSNQSGSPPSSAFQPLHSTPAGHKAPAPMLTAFSKSMAPLKPTPLPSQFGLSARAKDQSQDATLTDKQRQERQRMRRLEENYKTVMCDFMRAHDFCMFGENCRYAHSVEELRPKLPPPNHKTILCRNFTATGACPYGRKCRYIHRSGDDVQPKQPSPPKVRPPFEDILNTAIGQLDL
ncbi:unnamed protein product [Bursaphelenchus xylophilus]|uniref:(pine wood nematode) hypothetical protein n=1 Tax=Bursaphelenchus xylophilus TaxID=6326 RepID=A0A1I7S0V9_BURXY|nr:unnamed protein product [Bursaphelenchus xylophilus]CAG9088127.1 unnamed protein product [Bursaphelenchus xylophilus]